MGFIDAMKSVGRALGLYAETEAERVEAAAREHAEKVRDAEHLLDKVPQAVAIHGQKILDKADTVVTEYVAAENRRARLQSQIGEWSSKAKDASDQAKKYADGSKEYLHWRKLTRDALKQEGELTAELKLVERMLDQERENYEEALKVVRMVGLSETEARSQRSALKIENASAEGRLALAEAQRLWGEGDGPGKLLQEARDKVEHVSAQAEAAERIAEVLPRRPEAVALEIDAASADSELDTKLDNLLVR